MRRTALLLLLALAIAAPATAAPAPLQRRDREPSPARAYARLLAERKAKLDAMGVGWSVAELSNGRAMLLLRTDGNNGRGERGVWGVIVEDGDLCRTLGKAITQIEEYRRGGGQ